MSALKRIRDFKAPTNEASAVELRRQLGQFESNVSDMGASISQALPILKPTKLSATSAEQLAPGQSIGVDSSFGDVNVSLALPNVNYAGKWAAVWKRVAANTVTVLPPAGVLINGATSLTLNAVGLTPIFCDGVEYWIE